MTKVILDGGLFAAFTAGRFDELAAALGLDEDVLAVLRGVSASGLGHYRHTVQAKHLQHARAVLPLAIGVAAESVGTEAVLASLWERAPLPYCPAADLRAAYLDIAQDYLCGLPAELRPAWLPDLARYESMRAAGTGPADGGAAVAEAETAAWRHPPRDADVVSLASGVGVSSFQWDVVAIYAALAAGAGFRTVPAGPAVTYLAVASSDSPAGRTFRLAERAYRMLARCAHPVTVGELVRETTLDVTGSGMTQDTRDSTADSARKAIASALDCHLLSQRTSET